MNAQVCLAHRCAASDAGTVPLEGLHTDATRALSFGSVAERYDRFRPGYPEQLLEGLLRSRPAHALDVGCGTGKVAVGLIRRAVDVIGVEPDPRMAEVARRHGVPVEVATFEGWDDAGRQFDLIVSGHAWHWVDPAVGISKAARLLRPGGAIARFWNYHAIDAQLLGEVQTIYRELAPTAHVIGSDPSTLPDPHDPCADHPAFASTVTRRYRWNRTMTAEEWAGLVGTFGDHMRLGIDRVVTLQQALSQMIERVGGTINVHGGTYLQLARKVV